MEYIELSVSNLIGNISGIAVDYHTECFSFWVMNNFHFFFIMIMKEGDPKVNND